MLLILDNAGSKNLNIDQFIDSTNIKYNDLIYWQKYSADKNIKSIFNLIDENKEYVRNKYINFVNDISNTELPSKNLLNHFKINFRFSFWLMSSIYEKNPWKTENIYEVLKIIILNKYITDKKVNSIFLYSDDQRLRTYLEHYANEHDIQITFNPTKNFSKKNNAILFVKSMFSGLFYFAKYWRFNYRFFKKPSQKTNKSNNHKNALFIFSFFDNFKITTEQTIYSNYWGQLHQILRDKKIKQNWMHLFISHKNTKNPIDAMNIVDSLNAQKNLEHHNLLESYLTYKILFKSVIIFFLLVIKTITFGNPKKIFTLEKKISIWQYYSKDYFSSLVGPHAVKNILIYFCIDSAISNLPTQKKGLYLCEDQPWEKALISSWKKYKHGELIAVLHSPNLRYWDIFNFYPNNFYNKNIDIPKPDKVALNNPLIVNEFKNFYNKNEIIEVEALRYIWLDKILINKPKKRKIKYKVLILGDYTYTTTKSLLDTYWQVHMDISDVFEFSFKPHPNQPMYNLYQTIKRENRSMEEIITSYDIFFCGNMTYASVDGYIAGLNIFVMKDLFSLDLCPLNTEQALFISTSEELIRNLDLIINDQDPNKDTENNKEILFINKDLNKWKKLLEK
jgi:surface carbohydrate biosynthesis protein (TIGR04326 family)